jgi:hypothetical protein
MSGFVGNECRLLVTGGRGYAGRDNVFRSLDMLAESEVQTLNKSLLVITGAACFKGKPLELTGADRWAWEWALTREHPCLLVPARWSKLGDAAGPERNQRMIDDYHPTNVVAFPGGAGTADMVQRARKQGIIVWHPMGSGVQRNGRRQLGRGEK